MDINNLLAFIEVAECKSFSRSAEKLNITQPAVSKRIAALEAELSAKLFDRIGRSVHLTEAGEVLLPSARQISSELSRIEDVVSNPGTNIGGCLSIGTTEHIGIHHLPKVLRPFRTNYPDVEIRLQFTSSEEAVEAVDEGSMEIALCSLSDSDTAHPRLSDIEIWQDDLVIVAARNHRLATGEPVSFESLSNNSAILPHKDVASRRAIDRALQSRDLETRVSIQANDFETIKTLTSIGLGWGCLPEFKVDDALAVLPVEGLRMKDTISLVRHRDRTLTRAAQAFLELVP